MENGLLPFKENKEQNFVVVLENQRMVVNKDDRTTYDKSRNSSNDRALNSLDIFQVINQFIGEEIEKESCQCQKEYINKYLRSICNYSKNRTNRFYGRRNLERSNMIFDLSKSMNVRKNVSRLNPQPQFQSKEIFIQNEKQY